MATVSPQSPVPGPFDAPVDFEQEVRDLVNETAPRIFAVLRETAEEHGARDAWVAAWGMAHEDGKAQVISVSGHRMMRLRSAERAVEWTARLTGDTARLVWVEP